MVVSNGPAHWEGHSNACGKVAQTCVPNLPHWKWSANFPSILICFWSTNSYDENNLNKWRDWSFPRPGNGYLFWTLTVLKSCLFLKRCRIEVNCINHIEIYSGLFPTHQEIHHPHNIQTIIYWKDQEILHINAMGNGCVLFALISSLDMNTLSWYCCKMRR